MRHCGHTGGLGEFKLVDGQKDKEEIDHLIKIVKQMDAVNGTVALNDGRKFYGIILPGGVGNNDSGQSNADVIVRVKNDASQFEDHKFDVLDVFEIMPGDLDI
jgi:hypothetical protein